MADSYVTSGAKLKCSCGDKISTLTVYCDRTVFLTEKPMANISDHVSLYNIHPFGRCHTTKYPATGSATAANHGHLTPMPCVPGTVTPWKNGKDDYIVKGQPALLKSSYCKCMWGGIIRITDDGQTNTGDADLSRISAETEEEWKEKEQEELLADKEALLDGIQTALDLAGFAPGVGAIPDLLNAAISACRGNWAEAGMSVLAAVPGIGDAAAGAKLANRGLKMVKAAKKTEKMADVAKTVNKTDKAADARKMAKAPEEYDPEKLRRIRAKKMGIDPDDPRNGSGKLYDKAEASSPKKEFGSLTVEGHNKSKSSNPFAPKDQKYEDLVNYDVKSGSDYSNPFRSLDSNVASSPKNQKKEEERIWNEVLKNKNPKPNKQTGNTLNFDS